MRKDSVSPVLGINLYVGCFYQYLARTGSAKTKNLCENVDQWNEGIVICLNQPAPKSVKQGLMCKEPNQIDVLVHGNPMWTRERLDMIACQKTIVRCFNADRLDSGRCGILRFGVGSQQQC